MSIVERNTLGRGGMPAERRQLTILFCDLVGSTSLSTVMDPEDLHDLIVGFQEYCVRQIEEAGGFVARFAGDGILAYFGYPAALEDAPERALRAALALRLAGDHLKRPDGARLAVRVGVATGLVVVGELASGGAHERAVAGETPNMAARLQALADPDTVLVSETTKRLTDGLFVFRSRGAVTHKGFAEPSETWELRGPRATVSRYQSRRAGGVSPLIRRDAELAAILDAWSRAQAEPGSVVGVLGDPGMGKSRLLDETRRRLADAEGALWLEAGGASIYDNTPFYVASQIARRLAREGAEAAEADADVLAGGGAWTDPGRRDALMALLTQAIRATAARRPTVLVIEDLHWVDPSTMEWLDLLVRGEGARGLLLIYTSRTDPSERWPRGTGHRVVELAGLDEEGSAALARAAGGDQLSLGQVNAIVSRAGGVPLYVEELARLVAERPGAVLDPSLPPTLSDLMTARLEAAGPAKRHAQVASVLGQEFSASLFAAMAGGDEGEAAAALNELAARAVIVRRTSDTYAFRHALVAVAAYDTLLRRERRKLHERVAEIILARHALTAGEQPEVVARHWTQAGRHREALEAWQAAGELATQRRAFHEAEHAYRQALSVLEQAHGLDERDRIELTIRAAFNRVVQITQGYSAPEAGLSSQRVTELAERIDDRNARAREEQLTWRSVFTAGDYAAAEAIVERVMMLTQEHGPAVWRQTFRLRSGIQQGFYTGDLARGERDFQAWEAIQDGAHRGAGDDVLSMGIGGLIALMAGQYALARGRVRGAFDVATRRGNPYDLAMALHSEACIVHFAGEIDELPSSADRLVRVAADSGFEYAGHLATGWQAACDLRAGRSGRAHQKAAAAIRGFDRLGARVSQPFWLGLLAQAQWADGHIEEAHQTFEQALNYNAQELSLVPEVWIMRARLNAKAGREREAERDLLQAVRAGRRIGSPLFEFRAMTELAALSNDPNRRERARRAAAALADFDYGPSDRARFEALTT